MKRSALLVCASIVACSSRASAHHEALFGPQSSLAVESDGFVSLQTHQHVLGTGTSLARETTFILSGGMTPIRSLPLTLTLVAPFTYENARSAQGLRTGPFSSCSGCIAMENVLINAAYRIDFDGLQRATGKDGNFALASAAVEPPTGGKDYAPLHGPVNYILAGMTGFEWSSFAAVALGYFRINATDGTGSKKGNNGLAGLGAAYTPVDEPGRMLSFQLGLAAEIHARDVLDGTAVEASGGWELFASPTLVWAASKPIRFFLYVSLPISQDYRSSTQEDRWRAGVGIIYSFESSHAALLPHAGH